ncbi:hypothetical protein BJ508DRAFT_315365 [Ascobolus immersus RN42]|uniref:Uncharacterized protein n=1 Tax=Ascobolus immersus RN42 TaxID=1160509 RepID=A0A3N4HIB4_ASCIM|nr:hypothetical protein BJ508DRAFT_315365 [Ascobolus immersus RN42]
MSEASSQQTQQSQQTSTPSAKKTKISRSKSVASELDATHQAQSGGRELYKYCGLRNDDIAYLPINLAELPSLFAHNPLPHLPRNPDVMPVLRQLEDEWEEQVIANLRQIDSAMSDVHVNAYLQKQRRLGEFCPSEDEFKEACDERRTQGAVIRDALGIDAQHPAWDFAHNTITSMRSSTQAKILARAHMYAVAFLTGDGYEHYAKRYAGQTHFEINPTTKKPDPRIPPASMLPSSLDDLSVAQDILRDIHEGVDWDAFWKVPDPKKPEQAHKKELNHFGRSIVMKCKAYVQAECLNGLDWCDPKTGVYRRPQTIEKGKKVDCPMDRSRTVKTFIRSIDTNIRPARNCPREERRWAQLEREGHTVDRSNPRRVAYLYPLPRYVGHSRSRNVGEAAADIHINTNNMLLFDDVNPSDLDEDDGSSDEEEEGRLLGFISGYFFRSVRSFGCVQVEYTSVSSTRSSLVPFVLPLLDGVGDKMVIGFHYEKFVALLSGEVDIVEDSGWLDVAEPRVGYGAVNSVSLVDQMSKLVANPDATENLADDELITLCDEEKSGLEENVGTLLEPERLTENWKTKFLKLFLAAGSSILWIN